MSSILLVVRIRARKAHSGYHMNVRQMWACGCPSPDCLQEPQKLNEVRKRHLEPPIHKWLILCRTKPCLDQLPGGVSRKSLWAASRRNPTQAGH